MIVSTDYERARTREREFLALEALHRLSVQFASNRDFEEIVRVLLFTLSGQFGVPGLLAMIHKPGADRRRTFTVAVGPFRNSRVLEKDPEELPCWQCLTHSVEPCRSERCVETDRGGAPCCLQAEHPLSVVVPLSEKQTHLGFVALGTKHNGAKLCLEEIDLLRTIVDTVTPLLLNSFLLTDVRATKQWYESLLDNIPLAVLVCDQGGRLRLMNRAAAAMIADPPVGLATMTGNRPKVIDVLADVDLPEAVRRYLDAPESSCPRAFTVVARASGRVFNLSIARVFNQACGSFDTVLMLDDITQARKTEAHLFELERLAERGSMVSSIAHEIRNVLAVLNGGVELAQIVLKRGDLAKVETYLARVHDGIHHLERFAGELIDSKKLEAEKRPGSINDLVTNVATFLRIQRRFKSISLVTELDPAAPPIEMDSDQVSQLLLNLVNNSADAVREAGRPEGLITIRTVLKDGSLALSVTDNGCGIPDEVREKLFQLRFTTKTDGHGYGLVTCARIVANHQAELRVDSQPGAFTTISVAFPIPCTETAAVV